MPQKKNIPYDNLFNEAKKKMEENAGFQNFDQFSSALDSSTLI